MSLCQSLRKKRLDSSPRFQTNAWLLGMLLLAALMGCTLTDKPPAESEIVVPTWITNHPEDEQFPRAAYLTGLGSASARGSQARIHAEEQAKAEIARTIRTQIRSVLETYLNSVAENDTYLNKEVVEERIESSTEAELRGAEVVRTWLDPKTGHQWVKVALEKRKYANLLLSEIDTALLQIRGIDNDAPGAAGRMRTALVTYQAVTESLGKMARLESVVDRAGGRFQLLRRELLQYAASSMNTISSLVQKTELEVVSGTGQAAEPSGALANPIVIQARVADEPLVGFPFQFTFAHDASGAGLQGDAMLRGDGRATCRVLQVPRQGLATFTLEGRLDFGVFAPDFPASRIPVVSASFALPTLEQTRFAVVVEESNLGRTREGSIVEGRLMSLLTRKRAQVVELTISRQEALDSKLGDLCDRVRGQVDFVIRGRVESVKRPKQRFFFSYAGGRIEAIDVRNQKKLLNIWVEPNGTIKGADVSAQEQAGVAALSRLSDHLEHELRQQLGEFFAVQ